MKQTLFFKHILVLGIALSMQNIVSSDGTLNTNFGDDGFVTTSITGGTSSQWNGIKILSNGTIVAAGKTTILSASETVVGRYLADGTFDPSFNDGAPFAIQYGDTSAFEAVAVVPGCNIIAAGNAIRNLTQEGLIAQYNSDGSLDTDFAVNGAIFESNTVGFAAVAVQSDGQIVAVGAVQGLTTFVLARYNADGSADDTFGTNGIASITVPGASAAEPYSVALLSNGQILVGGAATISGLTQFFVARFNANGTLDTTFGTNSGFTFTPAPNGGQVLLNSGASLGIQSNGQIIFAGQVIVGGTEQALIGRYTANGILDTTYGTNGITLTSLGTDTDWNDVIIQADNKAVVAGNIGVTGSHSIAVARFLTNGSLDLSFGGNNTGYAIYTDGTNSNAVTLDIVRTIQGNGNLVLGGYLTPSGTRLLGLVELNDSVTVIPDPVSCITQSIYNKYCASC